MQKHPSLFKHIKQESKKGRTPQEQVALAEKLAKKHGGMLPNSGWLQKNSHIALDCAMRKHPHFFKHIKQISKQGRTPKEWVNVAKKLAKKHDGRLPGDQWRRKNGYSGLSYAMQKHPNLFKHIKQESKKGRTPQEQVALAEKLAKKHGGVLPNCYWLRKNGYEGLYQIMWKYPRLFRHIKQESKKGRTPQEWVPIAEKLARKHGGVLPNCHWLIKNNHRGLYVAVRKHPSLFKHIKQESKKGRTPQEQVALAEKLAKKHGGRLPHVAWLQKNGHTGLNCAMRKRPHLFKHIKQENKKGHTPEEWVAIAEKLVKKHGDRLPSDRWRKKNGYSGLSYVMQKHPHLFKHLTQLRKAA